MPSRPSAESHGFGARGWALPRRRSEAGKARSRVSVGSCSISPAVSSRDGLESVIGRPTSIDRGMSRESPETAGSRSRVGHDDMEREAHLARPPAVEVGPMLELAERARLIRGGLLNYTGMLISGVVGIAIVPTMLGHLGFEAYGLWVAVLAVVVLIGEVDLGLSTIVTREVAADPAYEKNETAQLVSSAAVGYL